MNWLERRHSRRRSRLALWLSVWVWGLGASACAASQSKAQEPGLIEVQAAESEAETAPAEPAADRDVSDRIQFKAASPIALRRFLEDLMAALLRRDYRHVLQLCEPTNLATQRGLGVDDEQYLSEALVPYWSRARIDGQPSEDDAPRFQISDLRRIRGVLIDRVDNLDAHREGYRVGGMLELSGSIYFVFQLQILRVGERYFVNPPVG